MSDNLPSLFDFDDEAFFPKQEEVKEEIPSEKVTADEPKPDQSDAFDIPQKQEENSDHEINNEAYLLEENSASKSHILQQPTEDKKENSTEDQTIPAKKNQEKYFKPKLELPIADFRNHSEENEAAHQANTYDKQIGNANLQLKSAFTFEPIADTHKTIEAKPNIETKPAVLIEEASATQNNEKSDGVEKEAEEILEVEIKNPEPEDAPLPEWALDKNYYTIGEVAQLFAVNVSHIRFWATEFKIKTRTTRKGDRLFTPSQISELRLIHHLVKVKKHTLKGAKEILKAGNEPLTKKLNLKEELASLYRMLSELKRNL